MKAIDDTAPFAPGPAIAERELAVSPMGRVMAKLAADPRLAGKAVARAHPLLGMVREEALAVLIAPASVWDRGRDVLRPFASKFADGEAMLVLLGRPAEPDLAQALN